MFFPDSQACNLPNSETPMDPGAISAQDSFIASIGQRFVDGNTSLNDIMTALGGNSLDALTGDAGVPTTGAGGFPFFPGPGAPRPYPGSLWGGGSGAGRGSRGGNQNRGRVCVPPVVVPLVAVVNIPQPRAAPTVPKPAAASRPPAPVSVAAPTRKRIAQSDCRTGNICLDIRNGCVFSDQVSPQQLLACSQAGYGGNANLYAQFDIDRGGSFGSPDLSPVPFDPSMLSNHPGLSGFGDDGSAGRFAAAGIGLLGLLWIAGKMAKGKGR
jgi:hypothetical protein